MDVLRITGRPVVIVTGEVTGATNTLELDIDSSVTVLWGASYSGETSGLGNPLIMLTGSGTFEVAEGGSVTRTGRGYAIGSTGANATITVRGGSVDAIYSEGEGTTINVSGGSVEAIYSEAMDTTINVSGGAVGSMESNLFGEVPFVIITLDGTVTVSGGTVASAEDAILASEVIISSEIGRASCRERG